MEREVTIPAFYLNTTIYYENAITFLSCTIVSQEESCPFSEKTSFHSFIFSNEFHRYRIAGEATAAGAGANAQSPQKRYEN
jgi:hypothetical protein